MKLSRRRDLISGKFLTLKKVSAKCALFRALLIHTFPQQCLEERRKEVKEEAEELTLLQKMRAMQQNIRGGEKGKSPRNNIVRKTRKETRMKKEDQEGMSKMRKILESWRKEADKQKTEKPKEGNDPDLPDIDKPQVKIKMNTQEQKNDVKNMIKKYSIKDKDEVNSYEAWKESRKEGKKRKASEEQVPSTNKKQDTGHNRVLENKSETGRKGKLKFNSYLAHSDGEGGGGHVRGGGAEVHGGRGQAVVQSARAELHNWQTRLGGNCPERKAL